MTAIFRIHLDQAQPQDAATIEETESSISADLAAECRFIADHARQAYLTPIQLSWDVQRYNALLGSKPTGQQQQKEEALGRRYSPPPVAEGIIQQPATVVDVHGVILLWYLPHVLSAARQEAIIQHTSRLSVLMKNSAKSKANGRNWRNDPELFSPPAECPNIHPGCINVSPAWFQQAHDTDSYPLQPSSTCTGNNAQYTHPWLSDMAESIALINAVMAIIHPDLYRAGRDTLIRMRDAPEAASLAAVLDRWTAVFNAVSVISSRETPIHRDNFSRAEWYDLLATVGRYTSAIFEVPSLGLRFDYSSGTIVGISGRVLPHGVSRAIGERLCLAFYMRDNVHERMKVRAPQWMDYRFYGQPGQ
ncbi:hypothetical protein PLICRDRAFT_170451 [Plicaturopsis crispa FD-325 SS-3]|nr:hypothetical protein PLICRDRAFT_170451 [Plicaturopsis crispa FD-325 SS-3]